MNCKSKVKNVTLHTIKAYGGVGFSSTLTKSRHRMKVCCQLHDPTALTRGNSHKQLDRRLVGSQSHLVTLEMRNICRPCRESKSLIMARRKLTGYIY